MTSQIKDFGDLDEVDGAPERLTFRLAGETFECYEEIPGAVLLRFVGASKDNVASAAEILRFLDTALVKGDSRDRFTDLINDPERVIKIEKLGEIVSWLVEVYGDRPETPPGR